MDIQQALQHLLPEADSAQGFVVRDGEIVEWNLDESQPTHEQLEAAWGELRREQREQEIVEALSEKLRAESHAGTTDLAMSLSIVKLYRAYKAGATPAALEELEALGDLAEQKIYEVRTAEDPDSVELP